MNEAFFNKVIDKYGNTVLRVAASVTGNLADAEDIFSDVFFTLWQNKKSFVSEENLKAWLIRVAINKAKNIKRLAKNLDVELNESIAAKEESDTAREINEAMSRLSPEDRAIIYLHYFEGFSYVEIAEMTGLTDVNVRSKAKRARDIMKEFLLENE